MGVCGMALTLGSVEIFRWKKYEVTTILPSGYTPVEYIESSGTQWINTKFNPTGNTRFVMDFIWVSGSTVFTFVQNASSSGFYGFQSSNGRWYVYYNNMGASTSSTLTTGTRYVFDLNKNIAYVDGTKIYTFSVGTFTTSQPLILGAYNAIGTVSYPSNIRVYSCQIYDNGTLVRDFMPCKNASGAFGLYDLVNNVFYTNNGSGAFAAGAEAENIAVGDFIEEVKSLNSNAYPNGGVQDGYYYERVV